MTIKEKLTQMLVGCGLFPMDAAEVMRRVMAAPENEAMRGRWDDDVSGYPPQLINVAWLTAKMHALEWIDENCPRAWFRPMFADSQSAPSEVVSGAEGTPT